MRKSPEQEPVAWKVVDKTTGEFMFSRVKPMRRTYLYDDVIPLYIHDTPPKREPLDDGEIADGCRACKNATHPDSFWAGVRFAEKTHGIEEADDDKFLHVQAEEEPLSLEDIRVIINQLPTGVDLDTGIEFCRIIEKAHGIGE